MNYLNKALDTFGTAIVSSVYYVFFTVKLRPPSPSPPTHPPARTHARTSAQPDTLIKPNRASVATRPYRPPAPKPDAVVSLVLFSSARALRV